MELNFPETPKYRPGDRVFIMTDLGRSSAVVLRYLGKGEYYVSYKLGSRLTERRMFLR